MRRKRFLKPTYQSWTFRERLCGTNKRSKSSCRCFGITAHYLAPNLKEFLHKNVWAWACLFALRTRWCLGQPAAKMQILQETNWLGFKQEQIDQLWLIAQPYGLPCISGGKSLRQTCCQGQSQKNFPSETHCTMLCVSQMFIKKRRILTKCQKSSKRKQKDGWI